MNHQFILKTFVPALADPLGILEIRIYLAL